jgi:hypothetical protein
MTATTLEKEAMKLPPTKRLRLAEKLRKSVAPPDRPPTRGAKPVKRGATLAETVRRLRPFPDGKSCYDLTKDLCGSLNGGPGDLATNKRHLKDLGKWKR